MSEEDTAPTEAVSAEPAATPTEAPTSDPVTSEAAPAETAPEPKAYWPDDWRDKGTEEDVDFKKFLDRYNDPLAAARSGFELRKKMDSGDMVAKKTDAPEGEEELAKWRKDNGVPESADKYTMPEGLVIGEEDQPAIEQFLNQMHQDNVPDGVPEKVVDWYFKAQEDAMAAESAADKEMAINTEEALREDWGKEYRANHNMVTDFVKGRFGDQIGEAILAAGPEAVKAMADIAREVNPVATLHSSGLAPSEGIGNELAALKAEMGTPEWYADPSKAERFIDLQSQLDRLK